MARFAIKSCRPVSPSTSEFHIDLMKGEIAEGDRFSCRGAFELLDFEVTSVEDISGSLKLTCDGTLNFEDEIKGNTLDTTPVRLPPSDLVVPALMPTPTSEELDRLQVVIEEWETRAPVQRAICVCMLRGDRTPEAVGQTLGISAEEVRRALVSTWGVLRDAYTDELYFK